MGALTKMGVILLDGHGVDGIPSVIWLPHLTRIGNICIICWELWRYSEGQSLLQQLCPVNPPVHIMMGSVDKTRALAVEHGYTCISTQKIWKDPQDYNKQLYEQLNQVERLFRMRKRFCQIFTRYNNIHISFLAFLNFALIVKTLMRTRPSQSHLDRQLYIPYHSMNQKLLL